LGIKLLLALPRCRVFSFKDYMDAERENKNLNREAAQELLAEAWLEFWSGKQTAYESDIRRDKIRRVLERLSQADREYFLKEEEGEDSRLAKIREQAKAIARAGKKNTVSSGKRLHIRRQKAAGRGINPKRIS
jgi:transcriptional regulator of met regulon